MVWVDILIGVLNVMVLLCVCLGVELVWLVFLEFLVVEGFEEDLGKIVFDMGVLLMFVLCGVFDSLFVEKWVVGLFNVIFLDVFGSFICFEIGVFGVIVDYLEII